MSIAESEPLFRSASAALKFAFNYSADQYDRPAMNKASDGPKRRGRGLVGVDGAAQAGLIRQLVDSLPPVQAKLIAALYLPNELPCSCKAPCCCGSRPSREFLEVIDWLQNWVFLERLTGTVSYHHVRRDLVLRWVNSGKKRPKGRAIFEIAARSNINRDTVSDYYNQIMTRFNQEYRRGFADASAKLEECGIVGEI